MESCNARNSLRHNELKLYYKVHFNFQPSKLDGAVVCTDITLNMYVIHNIVFQHSVTLMCHFLYNFFLI
jgi:hypothetical protein